MPYFKRTGGSKFITAILITLYTLTLLVNCTFDCLTNPNWSATYVNTIPNSSYTIGDDT